MTELTEKVITLISSTKGIETERITLDSTFEELDMDSLDGLALVASLENEFDIHVPNEKVLAIRNVRQVVDNLQEALGSAVDHGAVQGS